MGFYDNKILPIIIDKACSMTSIMGLREKIVPLAKGKVLEVGMGSGINLALYNPDNIDFVWGLEPSLGMRKKAQRNLDKSPVEVKWLDLPGEQIPLDDNSVDTVLLTYTLCTIPDWQRALEQMRRVLKPDGKLLFCEHGLAEEITVQNWQNRITPAWKKIAGGCHLNRPIAESIASCGFTINTLETCYAPGVPKIAGYMYYGEAVIS
ncbi:putative methyltransferase YcgJ [Zhongshania aliphaticivorans]|uniref:Putative methyltransferase YcgJ n=2 Tax=Zhongshania aliphaticivorans TaxID=1470434 RepID=A0A5S9PNG1_9GAMM|nr:putative methyltransferase YcgJ [Zhongshania aliphaticivorans]CAA0105677.1 putative methyltransferase YcgJ [Zhongshania aliphaticivorans]